MYIVDTNELLNYNSQDFLPSKISSSSFISSSSEQMLSTFTSISVTGEEIEWKQSMKSLSNEPH